MHLILECTSCIDEPLDVKTCMSADSILGSIYKDCMLAIRKGYCSKGKDTTTVNQIVKDLMDKKVFMHLPERDGYPSFPNFPSNLLHDINYRDLHSWMTNLIQRWTILME